MHVGRGDIKDVIGLSFTCKILPAQIVDCLLTTLVKQIGPLRTNARAVAVSERFLRSVVRVLCVCYIEGVPSSQAVGSKKKRFVIMCNVVYLLI